MLVNLGVVACGNEFAIKRIGPFSNALPFDVRITHHTGIGCASGEVFFHKIFDDKIPEFFPDIQDEMGKP